MKFKYDIIDFSDTQLQIQFVFEDPEIISQVSTENDQIRITFWDTDFFKNEQGIEVPFGIELRWEIFRQMPTSEVDRVDIALRVSDTLLSLIGVLIFFLVLSCGPLLPVWMFLNSLQLLVHVPLIRTNLPGNFNYYLLDYLNILRLQTTSFNVWL